MPKKLTVAQLQFWRCPQRSTRPGQELSLVQTSGAEISEEAQQHVGNNVAQWCVDATQPSGPVCFKCEHEFSTDDLPAVAIVIILPRPARLPEVSILALCTRCDTGDDAVKEMAVEYLLEPGRIELVKGEVLH
jgi:hypothetical protein